jgi:hypothetical protein
MFGWTYPRYFAFEAFVLVSGDAHYTYEHREDIRLAL